jgi:hypothetical protein
MKNPLYHLTSIIARDLLICLAFVDRKSSFVISNSARFAADAACGKTLFASSAQHGRRFR